MQLPNAQPSEGRTPGRGLGRGLQAHSTHTARAEGAFPCLTLSFQLSAASFFGDSYVEMPLADASRTVRLRLHLYTSQGSGLLFLAAGQPDHLLLQLRAGTLQVGTAAPRVPAGVLKTGNQPPGREAGPWEASWTP